MSTGTICISQNRIDSVLGKLNPQKFAAAVTTKVDKLEDKLIQKSEKVLNSMQRQEEKIYQKLLSTKDSLQAKLKLDEVKSKYAAMKNGLKNPVEKAKAYLPRLDSLNTSLKFLDANGVGGKVKDALAKTGDLQNRFQQTEQIKKFIRERREQLKSQLEKLRMVKQLKKINKQVFYYAQTIKEWKNIINDPKKIERKALELLSKTKIFKDFMARNSLLASMFRLPGGDPNDPAYMASVAGLQTRAAVNSLIQQQIAASGPNGMQQFQQNMASAQNAMNEIKNKLGKFGSGNSNDIMPEGFKPNDQKTKSFLKRLELGTNIQTQKSTRFFPTTSDLAISVGYKINDKSIIGIGGGTKIGLGRGWQHIRLSYEGISLRSFVDIKMKGNLWITGGYEMQYKTAFNSIDQLKGLDVWGKSCLIGISKTIPLKSKFFKKTKAQLLWDAFSYQQIPRTQPVIFRLGYNF